MKYALTILLVLLAFAGGWIANTFFRGTKVETAVEKITNPLPPEKPLEKYHIETLSEVNVPKEAIVLNKTLDETTDFTAYEFKHTFDPTLTASAKKTVTGQLNIPKLKGPFPLILMLRGFVSQEIYETGIGTRRAAEIFAKNGYITIAPDFLGYAGSDTESSNIFETRFQTYTTVLSILNSLSSISEWDGKNIFIWAHSNGGQVALTTLAITQETYPTTLWAPVTKPFPYSILYYTDESADKGKFLRHELSKFEELYDVEKYSFDNYLEQIKAPIQLHQGTNDNAIPTLWSSSFITRLKRLDKESALFIYPSADHNLQPGWDDVVARDLDFFQKHLQ